MKARTLVLALTAAALAATSGCHWYRFPNLGWRVHNNHLPGCGPCGACAPCSPAFSSPVAGPVVGYPVSSGPDCPGCGGPHVPVGYPPVGPYPPVIGKPMPLPGPTVVPSTELHNPTPAPGKVGN